MLDFFNSFNVDSNFFVLVVRSDGINIVFYLYHTKIFGFLYLGIIYIVKFLSSIHLPVACIQ